MIMYDQIKMNREMKKILISGWIIYMMCCCTFKVENPYQISGKLKVPSDTLLVMYVNMNTGIASKLDTLALKDGEFGFNMPDSMAVYSVGLICKPLYGDPYALMAAMFNPIRLLVVPGENAIVTGEAKNYQISGSMFYQDLKEGEGLIKKFQQEAGLLNRKIAEMEGRRDDEKLINIMRDSLKMYQDQISGTIIEYMKCNPLKKTSVALLNHVTDEKKREAFEMLDSSVKNGVMAPYARTLIRMAEEQVAQKIAAAKIQPGMPAPQFTLKDIQGKNVSLASFQGKYVVLDFWGSWCGWCIKGIPDMKVCYEKHKNKVEFIGIACNDTEAGWKAAVAENELPWVQLINDENMNVPLMYAVAGYPTKCIIDPNGNIVKVVSGEDPKFYIFLDNLLK